MKASDYLIMFVLCTTMMTGVTACSKDGDGKIELTSERKEFPKGQSWTVDGPVSNDSKKQDGQK